MTVTDGSNSASQTFVWTVTPCVALVNPGPQGNATGDVVSLPIGARRWAGGQYTRGGAARRVEHRRDDGRDRRDHQCQRGQRDALRSDGDGHDGTSSSSQTFPWSVAAVYLAPPADQSNYDGDTVALTPTVAYHGSGTLVFAATGLPPGLTISSSTGAITGTVASTADQNGATP